MIYINGKLTIKKSKKKSHLRCLWCLFCINLTKNLSTLGELDLIIEGVFSVQSLDNVADKCSPVQSAAAHPGGHQTRCCSSSFDARGELPSCFF